MAKVTKYHGELFNYRTGKPIRLATALEQKRSAEALAERPHENGVIVVDGKACFVEHGGPRAPRPAGEPARPSKPSELRPDKFAVVQPDGPSYVIVVSLHRTREAAAKAIERTMSRSRGARTFERVHKVGAEVKKGDRIRGSVEATVED